MNNPNEIPFENFFIDSSIYNQRKKTKKFKILEIFSETQTQPEPKPKFEILIKQKRSPPSELSDDIHKIERELLQTNVKKKHILHKTNDHPTNQQNFLILDKPTVVKSEIFKTKKFLHKKLEQNSAQTVHCVECKCEIPNSTTVLRCVNCSTNFNNNLAIQSENNHESIIASDLKKIDEKASKNRKFFSKKIEKIDPEEQIVKSLCESSVFPDKKNLIQNNNLNIIINANHVNLSNNSRNPSNFFQNSNNSMIYSSSPQFFNSNFSNNPIIQKNENNINISNSSSEIKFNNRTIKEIKESFISDWLKREQSLLNFSNNLTTSLEILQNMYKSNFYTMNNVNNPIPVVSNNNSNSETKKKQQISIEVTKEVLNVEANRPDKKILFKETIIPHQYGPIIMKIYDFLATFGRFFNCQYSPEEIYFSFLSNNSSNYVLSEINKALLSLFCKDISTIPISEFVDNENLILIKVNYELNGISIINNSWPQILLEIVKSNRYKQMLTEEILRLVEKIGTQPKEYFLEIVKFEQKLKVVDHLINTAFDLKIIKDSIDTETVRLLELLKEKKSLDYELKTLKARKKELQRTEYYLNAKPKIESYNAKLLELQNNEHNYSKVEFLKLKHEIENKRERYQSTLVEVSNYDSTKLKIQARLGEIKMKKNELIVPLRKTLSKDNQGVEYFFFKGLMNRIYYRWKDGSCIKMSHLSNKDDIKHLQMNLKDFGQQHIVQKIEKLIRKNKLVCDEEPKVDQILEKLKDLDLASENNIIEKPTQILPRLVSLLTDFLDSKDLAKISAVITKEILFKLGNCQLNRDYLNLLRDVFVMLKNPVLFANDEDLIKKFSLLRYKLIPKEYDQLDIDSKVLSYLEPPKSLDNIHFILQLFEGLIDEAVRRMQNSYSSKKPKNSRMFISISPFSDISPVKSVSDVSEQYAYALSLADDSQDFNRMIFDKIKQVPFSDGIY